MARERPISFLTCCDVCGDVLKFFYRVTGGRRGCPWWWCPACGRGDWM